jgi:RNase P subunit RPR2
LLSISCENCGKHLFYYQKDGPGILKRVYTDRISDITPVSKNLICPNCKEVIGTRIVYKKENRPAYRLFVGAVNKKILKI